MSPRAAHEPAIVPGHSLDVLRALLKDENEGDSIAISPSSRQILFTTRNGLLASRVMEGPYLSYHEILRKASSTRVRVSLAELTHKMQAAALVAAAEAGTVQLRAADGALKLSVRNAALGDIESTVAADIQGPAVQLRINGEYLAQVLDVLPTKEVEMGFNGPKEPGIIRPVGRDEYVYAVLTVHDPTARGLSSG
jgi:DNA polymerase-3 subunit beta